MANKRLPLWLVLLLLIEVVTVSVFLAPVIVFLGVFDWLLNLWSRLAAPAPHVDEATPPLLKEIERDEWVRGVELWLEMVKGKHE
jgi:hypothetical protein